MDKQVDNFYDKVLTRLEASVPGFRFEHDEGVYPVLGDFGYYILAHLEDEDIMKQCFDFVESAFLEGGERTNTAFCLTVFEQLYLDDKGRKVARFFLKQKSRERFEEYLIEFKKTNATPMD